MRSALGVVEVRRRNDGRVSLPAFACIGGLWGTDLHDVSRDSGVLEGAGRWIAVLPYDGEQIFLRFDSWSPSRPAWIADTWFGPTRESWTSSFDKAAYCAAVESTREAIARGDVYQANICRVMSAVIDESQSLLGLFERLVRGNPAPYSAIVHAPEIGVEIASASPELFLRRNGAALMSGPIKGTGRTEADLLDKDAAENVMIVDLVRNDLSRVCLTGSVEVPRLLAVEEHPGLVHLVSHVSGLVTPDMTWTSILGSTFPPGSVTGAPKSSALRLIGALEPSSRAVYCGALGWVQDHGREAEFAVTIRTFWKHGSSLHFGTGAGITWGSDPVAEWQETELKSRRLIDLASEEHS